MSKDEFIAWLTGYMDATSSTFVDAFLIRDALSKIEEEKERDRKQGSYYVRDPYTGEIIKHET